MRLTGKLRETAKQELLFLLQRGPRTTGELRGTPKFHGERTLTYAQIRNLLRETGQVTEHPAGAGMYTSTEWALTDVG